MRPYVHVCQCPECLWQSDSSTRALHQRVNLFLSPGFVPTIVAHKFYWQPTSHKAAMNKICDRSGWYGRAG
jgi:hypothetical protein